MLMYTLSNVECYRPAAIVLCYRLMFMQVTSAAARWRPSPCISLELRARVRLARAWTIEADGRLLVLKG